MNNSRKVLPGKFVYILLAVICLLSSNNFAYALQNSNVNVLVEGNNRFALNLYGQLAQEQGNLFFSPYSISSALAMAYAGSAGNTAGQMSDVLQFGISSELVHPALSDLNTQLNAEGKAYKLSVANALWGQKGYKFNREFLAITDKYYGAGFKEVDFTDDNNREQTRKTINKWVEEKTNNKIKELIKPNILKPLTRLVLTNAIYFKGKWQTQFKEEQTKDMLFAVPLTGKIKVPMMHQTAQFKYLENDTAQILEMPYAGGDLSMAVILPKAGMDLEAYESFLSGENVVLLLSGLKQRKVELYFPRFKLEKEFLLNESLKKLGMIDAFSEIEADFSGMTAEPAGLYISKVIHKAFVEVNEEGTEAAAATAVIMDTKSISPDKTPVFLADRPFIFLIRDIRSGSILFMGRVLDPR